jgi:hypothetical protein
MELWTAWNACVRHALAMVGWLDELRPKQQAR